MTVLEQGTIEIHTENIFPIIKKAVYSGHEVFLRELVSNGVDATSKRRMVAMAGECSEAENPAISIRIDRENKTLTVSDQGIGMTADEVKRYINQVAFSSAEEFLEKYKQDSEAIIGNFGLGFYSSFMVAREVELQTLSAREGAEPVRWTCDGSPRFTLEEGSRSEPGTDVILHLMDEELEYLEPARLKTLITRYCDFLAVDVQLEGESVNRRNAPWKRSARELKDEDYVELYRYLYPFQGDPLLWVHLNTDYPYSLQGILFFPKISGRADWESGEIRLYCNNVFVSDSIKEVVPRYLLPLRGVLDSPDIPLNVSRSALQTDRRVRSIGQFVAKKVADRLRQLHRDEPERYARIWDSLAPFIKIGAMEDEKFADQVADVVLFASTAACSKADPDGESAEAESGAAADSESDPIGVDGKTFTTLDGYLRRSASAGGDQASKVLYCTDEAAQAGALALWRGQGREVLMADTLIDAQFIPWLEALREELSFQRVDAELDESLQEKESELTDAEGGNPSEDLRSLFKTALANDKITVQVQTLKGEEAPAAMILLPEQMRRLNDMGALMDQRLPGLPEHHVLLVNRRHPLVEGLLKLSKGALITGSGASPTQQLSEDLSRHLYDMARLGIGGLEPNELAGFQSRSATLMGRLLEKGLL
ncbi:molecular chaperone HtpG [Synechococcus sp. RSCCF101]|uniref:molecular chaperone HtpG n=1 Tax=Synechococcus sp. RSCCF101 TaxID=2511069 RepID=UPI001246A9D7|nr:molecular chaperone HtpG [Synechococcus sp. RSCCF101]QEY31694.1 molecular chaperone HtpG [Synechococcus sp. RSCCF101]